MFADICDVNSGFAYFRLISGLFQAYFRLKLVLCFSLGQNFVSSPEVTSNCKENVQGKTELRAIIFKSVETVDLITSPK